MIRIVFFRMPNFPYKQIINIGIYVVAIGLGSYSILDLYEIKKQLILTWGETYEECKEQIDLFEGVKPLGLVNCLNFGDPKNRESVWAELIFCYFF